MKHVSLPRQHSQCKSEWNDVVKCLINGMKFYYEDNEEATWGTEKFSMKVKDILSWLEKQGEQKLDGSFVNVDEVREDFIQEVYRVLDADPTNDRVNQIIDAFDNLPTLEFEKQGEQKLTQRKDFISIPFGAFDSELIEETIIIPDGCVATIESNKIHIKREDL